MPRYIAFLRAVNVGGRVVKMDALRGLFERAGFDDVQTFIQSGNVAFSAKARATAPLERAIETRLADALGYDVPTFVRSPSEVLGVIGRPAFPGRRVAPDGSLHVGFLKGPLDAAARARLSALNTDQYRFEAAGREVYWLLETKMSLLKIRPAQIERALGGPTTFRSHLSLQKLAARHCAPER
ncbi:MAG: DUF1697 domain-containing protein [Vicinamibacterales bacterium]